MSKNNLSSCKAKSSLEIVEKIGLIKKDLAQCGKYSSKLSSECVNRLKGKGKGKFIIVAPTMPIAGSNNQHYLISERLVQSLTLLRKKAILCMPSFTLEDMLHHETYPGIHTTEDVLANSLELNNIAYLHNFISNYINNLLIFNGSSSKLPHHLMWNRLYQVRDESLKRVITGFGNNKPNRALREESFIHILTSELLAIVSASMSEEELKARVSKVIVGISRENTAVHLKDLKLDDIVGEILKNYLNPKIMQNNYGDPVLLYTSAAGNVLPEGNAIALSVGMALADYVVAKFDGGVGLSIEKFFNITCASAGLKPDMVVITTFVNELNSYGGASLEEAKVKNIACLEKGVQFLANDIETIKKFGVPTLVSVSEQREITRDEMKVIDKYCSDLGVKSIYSKTSNYNVKAGLDFVKSVLEIIRIEKSYFKTLFDTESVFKDKINIISKDIYRRSKVTYSSKAEKELECYESMGYAQVPVSISRSPYFKENQYNQEINIKSAALYAGAEIIIASAEDSEFMPYYTGKYNLDRIKSVLHQRTV